MTGMLWLTEVHDGKEGPSTRRNFTGRPTTGLALQESAQEAPPTMDDGWGVCPAATAALRDAAREASQTDDGSGTDACGTRLELEGSRAALKGR